MKSGREEAMGGREYNRHTYVIRPMTRMRSPSFATRVGLFEHTRVAPWGIRMRAFMGSQYAGSKTVAEGTQEFIFISLYFITPFCPTRHCLAPSPHFL